MKDLIRRYIGTKRCGYKPTMLSSITGWCYAYVYQIWNSLILINEWGYCKFYIIGGWFQYMHEILRGCKQFSFINKEWKILRISFMVEKDQWHNFIREVLFFMKYDKTLFSIKLRLAKMFWKLRDFYIEYGMVIYHLP